MRGGARMPAGVGMQPNADATAGAELSIQELVEASQRDVAIGARRRRGDLVGAAADAATFVGALRDLTDRGESLVVETRSRHRVRGRLVGVGNDCCLILRDDGRQSAVAFHCVAGITGLSRGRTAVTGQRGPSDDVELREVLHRVAESGLVAMVQRTQASMLNGLLVSVGDDVVTLLDVARLRHIVPVGAIDVVTWDEQVPS